MAMNTNEGRVQYEASSGQTAFDFNFAIFENTDLLVYNTPTGQTPNDTTDILIVNTDYTVTIDGTDGGQVVLVSPATLNDVITIVRSLPIERNYDYQANGDLYADTLDSDQEYQTYLIQDGDTLLKRSVTLPQSYGGDVDLTMPPPVANGYFKYNAAGTAIEIDATIYQAVASVGGNIQDVVDVASNISNVNTVANNSNNINTVADNSNNINTVADNNTNINTIVSNIGDINSIVDDISNIDKVANNITDINTFADTYFISDTAPSSPTEGDLWFDTTANFMKVYDGNGFIAAGSSVNGTSSRNTYTATAGQTTFSSTYDAGYVDVYRNGLKLAPSDFTATNGTTVVLNNACSLNDVVDIVAYGTFELADAYTKNDTDVLLAAKAPLASPALTGTPTAPTATAGTNTTQIATTAFVKAKSEADSIGVNQTWQDVTASRSNGVTYTNTAGKPIQISVTFEGTDGGRLQLYVNGLEIARQGSAIVGGNAEDANITHIIPNGSTYVVYGINGAIVLWWELR